MTVRRSMVAAEAVGVKFRRTWVLSDLDLTVLEGERLHLTGPNGAGKTTVLRCLSGAVRPQSGRVTIGGHPAGSLAARAAMGVCLNPEGALHPRLTAGENVLLGARLRQAEPLAGDTAARVAAELGVDAFARQEIRHCSAGQRARVSIARAMVAEPEVLLFDEPTRSLDAQGRERFWSALDIRPTTTVVLVSHDPHDGERCSVSAALPARTGTGQR